MEVTAIINAACLALTTTWGVGIVLLAIAGSLIYSMVHGHWGWFYSAGGAGGLLLAAANVEQTIYGVGGGGVGGGVFGG